MQFSAIWPLHVPPCLILILCCLLFTDTSMSWGSYHPISDSHSTFRPSCENIAMSNVSAWTKRGHPVMFDRCVNPQEYGIVEPVVNPWPSSELNQNKLFACQTCGKRYNYKHNLGRHIRQECGKEPQFHCPYCSHVTKHKASLQKHIQRRHSEMPNVKWGEGIPSDIVYTCRQISCFRKRHIVSIFEELDWLCRMVLIDIQ